MLGVGAAGRQLTRADGPSTELQRAGGGVLSSWGLLLPHPPEPLLRQLGLREAKVTRGRPGTELMSPHCGQAAQNRQAEQK